MTCSLIILLVLPRPEYSASLNGLSVAIYNVGALINCLLDESALGKQSTTCTRESSGGEAHLATALHQCLVHRPAARMSTGWARGRCFGTRASRQMPCGTACFHLHRSHIHTTKNTWMNSTNSMSCISGLKIKESKRKRERDSY